MAAGDRNKKGKPTDIVRHFSTSKVNSTIITLCGRKNPAYATDDRNDVTCLKCKKKVIRN